MENVLRTIVGIGKYFLFVFVVSLFILNPSQAVPFNGSLLAEVLEKDAKVDVVIRGTVTDERGEPIPGVTVSVSGTGIGTATDMDGRYSLTVPEGATLVFSFIGFETQ